MVRIFSSGPLERMRLANQIQGFRIPVRREAGEKNIIESTAKKRSRSIAIDSKMKDKR